MKKNNNKVKTTFGATGIIVGVDLPGSPKLKRFNILLLEPYLSFKKGDVISVWPKEILK